MVEKNLKKDAVTSKDSQIFIPALRKDLDLFPGKKNFDGSQTWVIFDPIADKYFRFSEKEHSIIIFLNKNCKLSELVEKIKRFAPDADQNYVSLVINFLSNNNLLQSSYKKTEDRLKHQSKFKKKLLKSKIANSILFIRIPIWNPDDFLTKTYPFIKAIFNKWILLFLFIFCLSGYVSVIVNWHKFTSEIIGSLNYSGLIKYGITTIILKVFHEFAHAYAAKLAGIRVRRFGIGFIMFFPRFFTDLTDSWKLKNKNSRMLIDAAGILIELLIGGIAALVWLNTGPGITNTIAYFVFAVSIINTILINGNPFIKFDGYYLLMDFTNIDNLQNRSISEIKILFRKYLFGINEKVTHLIFGARRYFVIIFGISCFIYRIFLYTGIILIIYFQFTKSVGIMLVCLEIYVLFIKPITNEVKQITMKKNKFKKKNLFISLTAFIVILFLLFAPLPWIISIPCIVDSEKTKTIYIKHAGFLDKFLVKNNEKVKKDQTLFLEVNPHLKHEHSIQKIKLKIYKTELDQIKSKQIKSKTSEKTKIQQILNLKNDLKENNRKYDLLKVISPISGIFILFDWHLKTGKWLEKGEVIGEVFSPDKLFISAYAKETLINNLNINDKVKVYLHNEIKEISGKVYSINSMPTKTWKPSPLLSTAGGPLEVLKQKNDFTYLLKEYYYQIIIKPDKYKKNSDLLKYSKTGIVHIRKYSSVGLNLFRKITRVLQKILSF